MKRIFNFLAKLLVAIAAVALTFVIIFLFTPSWQKTIVEQALNRDTSRQWQVGEVNIGPTQITLTDVYMLQGEVGSGIKKLHLQGPFWMGLLSGRMEVDSGEIEGLNMDLSRIRVGNLSSEDWQTFLAQVTDDLDFWAERVDLVLYKLAATGWDFLIRDVSVKGDVLLPGERLIPVRLRILEADSRETGQVQVEALRETERMEL